LDPAPGPLVLGALLREDETTLVVFLVQDESLDPFAHRDDLRGIDLVANRQFFGGD